MSLPQETPMPDREDNVWPSFSSWLEMHGRHNVGTSATLFSRQRVLELMQLAWDVSREKQQSTAVDDAPTMPQKTPDDAEPCPDCGKRLHTAPGGGVKCRSCGYWFCF